MNPTNVDPMLGAVLGEAFRIIRLLGTGSMARVYLAEQISMQRNVALKLLAPDLMADGVAAARFRREIEAVSRLHSPHTICFYDAGYAHQGPYIAMELLAGQTLRQRLDETSTLPVLEVISITHQIASSLQEAHEADVWHRDLKPENVHFCHQASPMQPFLKLLDFGLAKLINPGDDPMLTGKRQTVGTPAYMAPEMVVEERSVDHRADIYALGIMCFEMLTGERPFQESNPMKMALAQVRKPIPSACHLNPNLPESVDEFFRQILAKSPDVRPKSAEAAAHMLANSLGDRRAYR